LESAQVLDEKPAIFFAMKTCVVFARKNKSRKIKNKFMMYLKRHVLRSILIIDGQKNYGEIYP